MAVSGPLNQSPYVYDSGADSGGKHLKGSFNFNVSNRQLQNLVVEREVGCVYGAVLIGDPNGTPTRVPASGSIAEGITTVTKNQLNAVGFSTIEDVLAVQITATAN